MSHYINPLKGREIGMTQIKLISNTPERCYLIIDDSNNIIIKANDNHSSHTLTKTDCQKIIDTVYGFEASKAHEKIKLNKQVNPYLNIEAEDATLDPVHYQVIRVKIDKNDLHFWSSTLYNEEGISDLPNTLIGAICDYLLDNGFKKPYSDKLYTKIEFVKVLPTAEEAQPGVAYVVVDEYGVETGESVVYTEDGTTKEVTDTPEPDPADPDTIPDTEEKEEIPESGAVGGADVVSAGILNQQVTEKAATLQATETASIVNSVLTTSIVTVTVKDGE